MVKHKQCSTCFHYEKRWGHSEYQAIKKAVDRKCKKKQKKVNAFDPPCKDYVTNEEGSEEARILRKDW